MTNDTAVKKSPRTGLLGSLSRANRYFFSNSNGRGIGPILLATSVGCVTNRFSSHSVQYLEYSGLTKKAIAKNERTFPAASEMPLEMLSKGLENFAIPERWRVTGQYWACINLIAGVRTSRQAFSNAGVKLAPSKCLIVLNKLTTRVRSR